MHLRSTFLLLLVSGCGAHVAEDHSHDIAPIPEDRWCESVAHVECASVVPCCAAVGVEGDLATCEKNAAAQCQAGTAREKSAGRTYDPYAAAVCLVAAGKHVGCSGSVSATPVDQMDDAGWAAAVACTNVWRGAAPTGAACTTLRDCASAGPDAIAGCRVPRGATTGTCQVTTRSSEGQSCASDWEKGPVRVCGHDLVCVPDPEGGHCVRKGASGEPCSVVAWPSCRDGLTCDPVTRRCGASLPSGAACVPPTVLRLALDPTCAGDAVCDSALRVCTPPLARGATCDPFSGSPHVAKNCATSDYCDRTSLRCAPRKGDGAACEPFGDECVGQCSGGRCIPYAGVANEGACALGSKL